jgi:hypothetical protein
MIAISIHDSDGAVQRICVNRTDPIQTLENHIALTPRQLIVFRGNVLMPGFSFQYHGIEDSDRIHVVRPLVQTPMKMPLHRPPHTSLLRGGAARSSHRSLVLEIAKLADSASLGAIEDIKQADPTAVRPLKFQTTVVSAVPSPAGPNCDPLPSAWFTGG